MFRKRVRSNLPSKLVTESKKPPSTRIPDKALTLELLKPVKLSPLKKFSFLLTRGPHFYLISPTSGSLLHLLPPPSLPALFTTSRPRPAAPIYVSNYKLIQLLSLSANL